MPDISKSILEAINTSDHEQLKKLAAEGADLDIAILGSYTPLIYTITHPKLTSEQKIATVNELLGLGASVNEGTSSRMGDKFPVEYAISSGDKDIVKLLLNQRATIVDHKYCLKSAINRGHEEIVSMLLLKHKSINFIEVLEVIKGGLYDWQRFDNPNIKSKNAAKFLLKTYKDLLINNEIKINQPLVHTEIINIIDKTLKDSALLLGHTIVLQSAKVINASQADYIYVTPKLLNNSATSCNLTRGKDGEINGWRSGSYDKNIADLAGPASHLLVKAADHSFKATIDFSLLNVHSMNDLEISELQLNDEPYLIVNVKDTPHSTDLVMLYGISNQDLVADMFVFAEVVPN